ncbi:hypothetical protein [Burkholderia gladioli]|uniref:hypothetical protein n=1 Tax=Burkholderia gladioli TaxID=28095 RepID=UPI001640103E|nr:hypothetical protein [Burkholderia gladioli]
MLSARETLELCREAYHALETPNIEGGALYGQLLSTQANKDLLRRLVEADLSIPNTAFQQTEQLSRITIEISIPRSPSCFFGASLDDLFSSSTQASYQSPAILYLVSSDEICSATEPPKNETTQNYLAALCAVQVMQRAADYEDKSTGTIKFVYLQREKVEVPIVLRESDLRPIRNAEKWLKLLSEELHKDQRKAIFRTTLTEAVKSIESPKRLGTFISMFDDLYQKFLDSYDLYVADFSVDKIIQDAIDKKFDYILKISKTFSDIQNQILAIPVAVIIAGGQMQHAYGVTLKNSIILTGIYIFAALMALLVRNQLSTLSSLSEEIAAQKSLLTQRAKVWPNALTNMYSELERRETRYKHLLWGIDLLVACSVAASTMLFVYFSGAL